MFQINEKKKKGSSHLSENQTKVQWLHSKCLVH